MIGVVVVYVRGSIIIKICEPINIIKFIEFRKFNMCLSEHTRKTVLRITKTIKEI